MANRMISFGYGIDGNKNLRYRSGSRCGARNIREICRRETVTGNSR